MALAMATIAIASPNPMHSSLTLSNARGKGAFCTRRRTHSLKITGSSLADGFALFQATHYIAYASLEAKSSFLQLPKIPSFHIFARWEQYASMDEYDFKRKWTVGVLVREYCISKIDLRNYKVDTYNKSGIVIGLGSSIAFGMAMQYIGLQLGAGALKDIVGIPTYMILALTGEKGYN